MKNKIILLILIITPFLLKSQQITGQWNGILKVQGLQLRLVFNVYETESGYSATMDSPDQGVKGISVSTITYDAPKVKFVVPGNIEYSGELKDDEIIGIFKQNGQKFPLNLSQKIIEKEIFRRPQEPSRPYPYYSEDVSFQNKKANIYLSGTLTLPKRDGKFPVVILISGSGPQNRDEEIMKHKPFLIISDYLTKNGIGVLRYDDRGVGKSTGDFKTATSADFATDVESAIAFLKKRKEVIKKSIGLIGHSEGGIIAPMVASKSKDVAFIILLAGTGVQGSQILITQQKLIGKAQGVSDENLQKSEQIHNELFNIVIKSTDIELLKIDLTNLLKQFALDNPDQENLESDDEIIKLQVMQIANPWMQYFIKYDPAATLMKVKCPVLALNGEKDLQVSPKENLEAIKDALTRGGNKNTTVKELSGLNHLFQECTTGSPDEYASIEQTVSPSVLNEIVTWIKMQLKYPF